MLRDPAVLKDSRWASMPYEYFSLEQMLAKAKELSLLRKQEAQSRET